MIFLTVGTQLPFERLVQSMDEWSAKHSDIEIFAQIGETQYQAKHMEVKKNLSPNEYQEKFNAASVVVSHVGMGTIISGLSIGKPMVLMPRQAALEEHRNDHQLATARKFENFNLIDIAHSPEELFTCLDVRISVKKIYKSENLHVSPELRNCLTQFLNEVKEDV